MMSKKSYYLSKFKYYYGNEYKKIHRNDISNINKKILDSDDLKYVKKRVKIFINKNNIKNDDLDILFT